ncbi:hypothetical protein [Primorskyibacter sp. 2E233]|uniref:hypothetical protein n=1 Tax=Primorskyibacter sp. 2E233 TaxID=3413431 RepID=UPI003BF07293
MTEEATAFAVFLKRKRELLGTSSDYSLDSIDSVLLQGLERQASDDEDLRKILGEFKDRLSKKRGIQDTTASAQAYEIFGEAVAYSHLSSKFKTRRLPTRQGVATPDFECHTREGKKFFVEVKSLEIVDGEFRLSELQEGALESQIDIDRQIAEGKKVAFGISETAPYRKFKEITGHSPHKQASETISKKLRGAFKSSQFNEGPTFGYAIVNKLIIPGGKNSITPYYTEKIYEDYCCMTGCVWMATFGTIGMLILDPYEFEGKGNVGGLLSVDGLFSGEASHPAQGLILSCKNLSEAWVAGLANPHAKMCDNWGEDDTDQVLHELSGYINDATNERAFELAHRD